MTRPGPGSWTVSQSRVLLVEGKDEERFLKPLVQQLEDVCLQVLPLGGKGSLRRNLGFLQDRFRQSGLACDAVGVLRDADDDAERAYKSVRDSLLDAGWAPPSRHGEVRAGTPSVGIFIVPDGSAAGAMETLCRRSVEATEAGGCATEYLACLRKARSGIARSVVSGDKAYVHAYLASGEDPVVRLGEGAEQGVWDYNHAAFSPLVDFVRQLSSA